MAFMRAVDIRGGAGGVDALFLHDRAAAPVPGPGHALVRVKAFGLNRMDLLQREGRYPLPPGAPATLGVEFSGVVEAVVPDDGADDSTPSDISVGDHVLGLVVGGAYAELVAAPLHTLLRKPPGLSWVEAAAVPETWMTALQALHEVGGWPAETETEAKTVLWHAGASGVSIAGIQLARRAGARAVYATAGSDAKCAFVVRALGAAAAFNYRAGDWAEALAAYQKEKGEAGEAGVDLIVDFVGAAYFQQNLAAAAPDGRIVLLALLGGARLPADGADLAPLLVKRLRLEGSSLRTRGAAYQARLRDRLAAVLPAMVGVGPGATAETAQTPETDPATTPPDTLRVFVDRVFSWEQIRDAHAYMEQNVSMGKIVCTIP